MRALWLAPVLALTLTACSGEPRDELREDVEAVTVAANGGSAASVRSAVEELLSTLRSQVASGDLDPQEAARLRTLAERIAKNAGVLEPTQAPSPLPTEEEEPEPEPTEEEEPEPEPTEEEEPEPTKEPEPEPTEEEPEPEPTIEVELPPVEETPTPAQQSQGGTEPSPAAEASPAA